MSKSFYLCIKHHQMLIPAEITTCPYCATKHRYYQAMSDHTIGATQPQPKVFDIA